MERVTKPGNLLEELSILKSLQGTTPSSSAFDLCLECPHAPRVLCAGRHEDEVNFIAMELYGENVSVLRFALLPDRLIYFAISHPQTETRDKAILIAYYMRSIDANASCPSRNP